ncbi:GNAT family N-acetyltransferase [Erysipelotrichaceae bacterium RD49]|nr:GNAT family N-acetyltransferase [Erysipelotrichaceae bacterium RD49]
MIRQAKVSSKDIEKIHDLLSQVLNVHHNARPDLFKAGARKYTDEELIEILNDPQRPVFVYENEDGQILGYAFCVLQQHLNNNILTDIKTLYIDDLCVDQNARHQRIGHQLYEYVCNYAAKIGCYNVTLNVWADNTSALKFYESLDLKPQKVGMEKILVQQD